MIFKINISTSEETRNIGIGSGIGRYLLANIGYRYISKFDIDASLVLETILLTAVASNTDNDIGTESIEILTETMQTKTVLTLETFYLWLITIYAFSNRNTTK